MKVTLNPFDCTAPLCESLKNGVLLTTRAGEKVNTMTIGWGHIGIEWGRPIFIAYVRESRYTHQLLEENGEFTVNIPVNSVDKKILGFCGTRSGRDLDKIREMDLHLEDPVSISVPGIREFPMTLECKVIYKQKQDPSALPGDILARYYAPDASGLRDCHYAYYGQILNAYLITD